MIKKYIKVKTLFQQEIIPIESTCVSLDYSNIEEVQSVVGAEIVTNLSVNLNDICNFEFLIHFPSLRSLTLNDNINGDITTIPTMPFLRKLSISPDQLEGIDFSKIPELELLYIELSDYGRQPYCRIVNYRMESISINRFSQLPNLTSLCLDNNYLQTIPDFYMPCLTHLYLNRNCITHIPDFKNIPNLVHLALHKNLLQEIPSFKSVSQLSYLDVGNNCISSIPDLQHLIQLQFLDIMENPIISLPVSIINMRHHLKIFAISDNRLEFLPPPLVNWITKTSFNNLKIYNDSQNVHDHTIQESVKESIWNIMSEKVDKRIDQCLNEMDLDDILDQMTKTKIRDFCSDETIHSIVQVTYSDIFRYVWTIIQGSPHKNELKKILQTETIDSVDICFTGRITRLINCLNGFDSRVKIKISDKEAIINMIICTKRVLEAKNNYSVENHVNLFKGEMHERGYNEETIQSWIQYIV